MTELSPLCHVPRKGRILIVEDEAMLAFDLEEYLSEAGFDVAGVAGKLEVALTMIDERNFHAAVLDTNLAGVSAGPAALALKAMGTPFVVVTGYLPKQLHSDFLGARCIQKPCPPGNVAQALQDILQAR